MALKIRHVEHHWLPRAARARAMTFGRTVFWAGAVDTSLVPHELVHVRQYQEHGFAMFLVRYLTAYFRGRLAGKGHRQAYLDIPFEVQAREAEARDDAT